MSSLYNFVTIKSAKESIGGLTRTSKMPGFSWNLPALIACPVGDKLAKVEGSVCSKCYATKGRYLFSNVKNSMNRHLEAIGKPEWEDAMVYMISNQCANSGLKYFRWHDSGDLINMDYLKKIVNIIKRTPSIRHWLPTREYRLVKKYVSKYGDFPDNVCVRVSAHMINKPPPPLKDFSTSTVSTEDPPVKSVRCKAYTREGKCGGCRACWVREVKNVDYHIH